MLHAYNPSTGEGGMGACLSWSCLQTILPAMLSSTPTCYPALTGHPVHALLVTHLLTGFHMQINSLFLTGTSVSTLTF